MQIELSSKSVERSGTSVWTPDAVMQHGVRITWSAAQVQYGHQLSQEWSERETLPNFGFKKQMSPYLGE